MKIIHFDSIDSTNAFLKREYASFDHLTFVDASFQTAGRGREDRIWEAQENKNLMFSVLVKDSDLLKEYASLSVGFSYVICKYLNYLGLNALIKWPNDILINDKKIVGILLEGDINKYLIIGVGLNVNQTSFPPHLRRPATSLKNELGKNFDINALKENLYSKIASFLNNYRQERCQISEYLSMHNYLLNRDVEINGTYGKVIGIDSSNFLIVKTDSATLKINSGEVHII